MSVPSWWPFDGKDDVLLSKADRTRWRDEGWWWPTVIAVLAVLVVLALWWLLAQLRRGRLAEVLVDSGDGEGALLRGRALEGVLGDEAEALDGVVRRQGHADRPADRPAGPAPAADGAARRPRRWCCAGSPRGRWPTPGPRPGWTNCPPRSA